MKPTDALQFPKGFHWGAATSAPQTEGAADVDGKSPSTWDKWFELEPERFDNHVGPQNTSHVYEVFEDEVARIKEMKLNSYRTSIAWTRLLPDGKTVNEKAVAYYRAYFQALLDNDITPIINLFHFDMPWWMMEQGGWINPEITDHFAFYAQTAVALFGDQVSMWTTFNEPIVHVECSYLFGYHYPAETDFKKAVISGYHTILAHAKAILAMREENPKLQYGTILNLSPVYARSNSKADMEAKRRAELINTDSFLDGMVKGKFSQELIDLLKEHELLPAVNQEDLEIIAQAKVDFLGVNYYQPRRVKAVENPRFPAITPVDMYAAYEWPERRMNPYRGWEIYPEGIYDIATLLKENYDNIPWYLSENGMGVADEERFMDENGMIVDDYRIEFVFDHLKALETVINEGSNCFGYHMWTFADCWSWLNGYRNRYGFYRVDLETQKRSRKKSSYWLEEVIKNQKAV